jgi:hypothetical protein
MKRRDFLAGSAGLIGTGIPLISKAQVLPCPPSSLSIDGGTSSNTLCGSAAADAEADWLSRISGSGVVWFHDFRSEAEVDNFRWSSGIGSGNDPNGAHYLAEHVRRITDDGITGGGCLEMLRPAGGGETSAWWRPFSPLAGSGNGKGVDDPAANGTLTVRPYSPSQGSDAVAGHQYGWYGHSSYHNANFDGEEFYLQMRAKRDPRRISGGNQNFSVGKFTYLTICRYSLSNQELVTYSAAPSGDDNRFRIYGGWQIFQPLDQAPGTDGSIQPGGVSPLWSWSGGWDTIMYHLVMGRENTNETLLEIYAAHPGETGFTLIWQQTFAFFSFDSGNGLQRGLQALICSTYNNGQNLPGDYWDRWDQIIFSKEFIPCPQV